MFSQVKQNTYTKINIDSNILTLIRVCQTGPCFQKYIVVKTNSNIVNKTAESSTQTSKIFAICFFGGWLLWQRLNE